MAVPGRLPRVVPEGEPFVVEGKVVPPGVSFPPVNKIILYEVHILMLALILFTDYCWHVHLYHAHIRRCLGT